MKNNFENKKIKVEKLVYLQIKIYLTHYKKY